VSQVRHLPSRALLPGHRSPAAHRLVRPREAEPPGAAARRQVPRLWLSCQGTVSPLHYDAATSFLTQVRSMSGPRPALPVLRGARPPRGHP